MQLGRESHDPSAPRAAHSLPIGIWDLASALEKTWSGLLAPYSIAPSEFRVLSVCFELTNCTAVEIAARAPVDPSSISRIVHRLVQRGLLSRRRSQIDRRLVTLRLTSDGMELMQQLTKSLQHVGNDLGRHLTKNEFRSFASSLTKLLEGFSS